jgi:hypothetical protein
VANPHISTVFVKMLNEVGRDVIKKLRYGIAIDRYFNTR